MIPIIRIKASDFIGSSLEKETWDKIKEAKKSCRNEFKILFWVDESKDIMETAENVSKHTDSLQLQTLIKVWEKCKNEYVFLDVLDKNHDGSSESRFQVRANPPFNIIMAMDFITDHFKMLKDIGNTEPIKKQKRNDSKDYDYNKK